MTAQWTRRRLLQAAIGSAPALWYPSILRAESRYPGKPVVIKVAFPAGGPADASIRAAAVVLQKDLGQNVLADNLPGASGSICAMNVLRSPSDGYTLLGTTGIDFIVAPLTVATAKYRPDTFKLLGLTGMSDFILVSNPSLSFRNVDEVIAYAKNPANRKLSIAHWGPGSAPHLVAADFQARAGIQLLEVPYKGAAPVTNDIAGAQVDLTFMPMGGPTFGMIKTNRFKPIGVASKRRNPSLPDVPAIAESRLLQDFEHSQWAAVLAPPDTPEPLITRLNQAMNAWIVSPENRTRVETNLQRTLEPMTVAQAQSFLKSEHTKFTRIAQNLKIGPQ
ncbi:tripartite tricarboxylate transporter substrate binding protein [Cupriavidus sp. RAF12]|uniref:tripartite tricarboxylate transporter substrate binding protein n=1 Tax=Cupriavidus sp. RAF12 TaxID=3233050 RepID=UPI003F93AE58